MSNAAESRRPLIPQTLQDPRMRRAQRRHAISVVVLSATGILLAVGLALAGHPPNLTDLVIFLAFFVITGLGISVGYHRLFTHQSFKAAVPVRVMLAIMGSMAMQGTLKFWVALHRRHHQHSDRRGDPHSPYVMEDGTPLPGGFARFWHSYMAWIFGHEVPNSAFYARDLMRDPLISRINDLYFVWVVMGLALPALIGALAHGSWIGALQGLAWGGLIRLYAGHNMIWSITSLTHIFGHRDFSTPDRSTNNAWLSVFTLGESWHNNHHAFPAAAVLSFRWYQFDISGLFITLLEKFGLVWNVGRPAKNILDEKLKN
ncbi:MAG: acyl-CoA desaturase [Burkholderiaceae bacterium]